MLAVWSWIGTKIGGMNIKTRKLYLENLMDRGAWQIIVHRGHRESDMTEQLTLPFFRFPFSYIKKNVAHNILSRGLVSGGGDLGTAV